MDFSRNWLYISPEEQSNLAQVRVLIIGCGIGSFIAELLVRTGIRHITIADGDKVELTNLNRQNYISQNIGSDKCLALASRLKAINPLLELRPINKFLDKDDLEDLIAENDFIINTMDFDNPDFLVVSQITKKHQKTELFPINIGFTGTVLIFNKDSSSFLDLFRLSPNLKFDIINYIIETSQDNRLIEYWKNYLDSSKGYDPQLGIATFYTSALVAHLLVNMVQKQPVKLFPLINQTKI